MVRVAVPLLNQLGFFVVLVVFGVLLDTFVVRPLLVPAMMSIMGSLNFWPARMPAPTKPPFDINAFRCEEEKADAAAASPV